MQKEKTFEEKMLQFEESSLRFQETALRSLIRIETKLKTIPGDSDLGSLAEIIRSDLQEVGERLGSQHKKGANEGGRKFTKKYRK